MSTLSTKARSERSSPTYAGKEKASSLQRYGRFCRPLGLASEDEARTPRGLRKPIIALR